MSQVAPPGEIRIGTQVREMMRVGSRMVPFTWEFTDYQADAKMAFRTIEGPMNWEGGYEVAANENGATRIIGLGPARPEGLASRARAVHGRRGPARGSR